MRAGQSGAGMLAPAQSGFFVAYPTDQEGADQGAYRAGVLELAELLSQAGEFRDDVLLACRVAAADRIAEQRGDLQRLLRAELQRYPFVDKVCCLSVGAGLPGLSRSELVEELRIGHQESLA